MVKCFQQLYSWEKQITKDGTRIDKLKRITEKTLESFTEARNRKIIIHNTDLRRWNGWDKFGWVSNIVDYGTLKINIG